MDGSGAELDAESMKQLEHRVVARLRARCKCLVEAFAAKEEFGVAWLRLASMELDGPVHGDAHLD